MCAPGPFLPTVLTSAILQRHGTDDQQERWLPGLVDGSRRGATAFAPGRRPVVPALRPVLGAGQAQVVVLGVAARCVGGPGLVRGRRRRPGHHARRPASTPPAVWPVCPSRDVEPDPADRLDVTTQQVRDLAAVLLAAEAVGGGRVVSRHRRRLRQGPRAVRPAHRAVPGGEAPVRRHARCRSNRLAPRRGTPPREADERPTAALAAAVAARALPRGGGELRQGLHPGARRHRVHLGARRPPLPEAGDGGPGARRRRRRLASAAWPTSRLRVSAGRWRSTSPPATTSTRAQVRDFVAETQAARPLRVDARGWPTPATWSRTGRRRGVATPGRSSSSVIDEEFAAAKLRRPHLQVGAWVLPTLIAHGTAEQQRALDPGHAAGRDLVVPDVQRARRGLRPGVAHHQGRPDRRRLAARRARRCGRRWPIRPTAPSAWPAPIPIAPSTTASAASSST